MTKPDLMAELAALKETLAIMAQYAPPPGTLCAPTMQMKLGWDAKSLLAKIDAHHAELEAAVRKAARYDWLRDRLAGADHISELVEYNHDMHPEMRVEVDSAIDERMHKSAREG